MKHYLCKFIPPRADFLATMTADERSLMAAHGRFLDERLADGRIVAHGPVIDASGGFGLALYRIADDEDIEALTARDPIVQGGVGRYEHYTMLHIKSRG